ncbi:MAG: MFS transporter [Chloroflexi bacterium HGW-Chloroflexi-6]|nr:MAG: MFS transporter [Chloroflexi bacterium HGW-Chloroflexi-6]
MLRPNLDLRLLFVTRSMRLFAYGFLSVVLALYLAEAGLSEIQVGLLLTLTLAGDAAITLWLTTNADRLGRRRMLLIGALLMLLAGMVFIFTRNPILLAMAAIIGVLSPSGNEIGPFLSVEQASLTQLVTDQKRTQVFAWYNLVGSFATATGALLGGWLAQGLQSTGWTALASYQMVLAGYALAGLALALCFLGLSPAVEVVEKADREKRVLGLHKSRKVVLKLSALFALDAFAGGLIVQSMFALWFHMRFGIDTGVIGSIFFGANILAGISALLAVKIAKKFGLINTMVFTHIPSSIFLMLMPLMPNLPLAITLLLLRFSISQMDVPTRQSYTMAVVAPDERSAASGVTSIARSVGAALSPTLAGIFLGIPALLSLPFFLCGGLKIIYDLALWREFRQVRPPEESQL